MKNKWYVFHDSHGGDSHNTFSEGLCCGSITRLHWHIICSFRYWVYNVKFCVICATYRFLIGLICYFVHIVNIYSTLIAKFLLFFRNSKIIIILPRIIFIYRLLLSYFNRVLFHIIEFQPKIRYIWLLYDWKLGHFTLWNPTKKRP